MSMLLLLVGLALFDAADGAACEAQWESTQTDPDAAKDAQKIDFLDSGKVADGFTVALKLRPDPVDTSGAARYTDMGLVSQCSCKCGTEPEKVPAHSGMLVGLKTIGAGTGVRLAFLVSTHIDDSTQSTHRCSYCPPS